MCRFRTSIPVRLGTGWDLNKDIRSSLLPVLIHAVPILPVTQNLNPTWKTSENYVTYSLKTCIFYSKFYNPLELFSLRKFLLSIYINKYINSNSRLFSDQNLLSKLNPSNSYPTEHPFNRDGYRYFLAEPDLHAPFRQEFDESNDTAGKPIPPYMYRVFRQSSVTLSANDRGKY